MSDAATGFSGQIRSALLPRLGEALSRFPLAIAGAALLTVFLILVTEDYRGWQGDVDFVLRIVGTLTCGALWSVSMVLFAEANGKASGFGHALGAVGAVVAGLIFWFHREIDLVEYGLATALIVLVGLAPYLLRARDNRAFWEFNHDLWIGAAFALIAGVLLAGGVSATLATLEYLFKIDIRKETWPEVWMVALTFVAPLYWLNTIPKRFDAQVVEGNQKDAELTTRLITVLAKFILVPLLLIYTVILYVYAVKIGIGWELPRGKLGYMVSAFGVIGVVTALLVFPSRDHAGALVRFFWQHWFWLTLVPLGLLFLGVIRRISDYGLTQERYHLVLLGVWLLAVVVLFGLRFLARDLRIIPATFAGLLALTSVGPWSLEGLPLRLLVSELRDLLAAEGSLDSNGVIKAKAELPTKRDRKVQQRMSSIVKYLRRQNRLDQVRSLLGNDADTVLGTFSSERARRAGVYKSYKSVMSRFVIPTHQSGPRDMRHISFNTIRPKRIEFASSSALFGPVRLYKTQDKDGKNIFRGRDDEMNAVFADNILRLTYKGDNLGRYDLKPVAEMLEKVNGANNRSAVVVDPISGSGRSQIVVTKFYGQFNGDDKLTLNNLGLWITLPEVE